MQQGTGAKFQGRAGGPPRQGSSDFVRKTVRRPSTFAELKGLIERRLSGDRTDPPPAKRFLDVAVPALMQILRRKDLRIGCRVLRV